MDLIKLDRIKVGDRLREDLGDVEALARSIRDNGLMQPIVLDDEGNLIAGGRRLTAFGLLASNKVESEDPSKFGSIPFVKFGSLSPSKRRLLEIEENLRRKSMTWQEEVLGIYEYHRECEREAVKAHESWSQEATGQLLGMAQTSVSLALRVAKELKKKDSPLLKCENMREAVTAISMRALDEAAKEQLRRIAAKQSEMTKNVSLQQAQVIIDPAKVAQVQLRPALTTQDILKEVAVKAGPTKEEIARFYLHGDSLKLIPEVAKTQLINHIICDPPFGIDMDNLDETNVERVLDEHQVDSNLKLIENFLLVSYENIAKDGFLCMWYDLDHHEKIAEWARKIGWKVCRWPLVWCKSSPCRNSSAQYNITKSTEVCYFLRRSESSIIKTKQSKNFIVADSVRSSTHPFVKPRAVWDYCIDTVSTQKQLILDPFAGEGSSLSAIFNAGRIPLGIELKEEHIANGLSFIQEQLGQVEKENLLNVFPL